LTSFLYVVTLMSLAIAQHASNPLLVGQPVPAETQAVRLLRSYLTRLARVVIKDGRVFIGMFACIDKGRNIVLINTDEFRMGSAPDTVGATGRFIGMTMIPWRHITSVEIENEDDSFFS